MLLPTIISGEFSTHYLAVKNVVEGKKRDEKLKVKNFFIEEAEKILLIEKVRIHPQKCEKEKVYSASMEIYWIH